jgi:hypothetical protein
VILDVALAAGVAPGDVVPWRDVLHDGPVPAGLAPEALAAVRAAHLAARGWTSEADALAMLRERDARLEAHPPDDEVVLWFEDDLYDALQLAQVADRLAGRPGPVSLVPLPHGPRRDLAAAFDARGAFEPDPAPFAALRSPDPRAWVAVPAFARLLEELPDRNTGLSRLEREILDALTGGALDPEQLFLRVAEREQPPWLGDTAVFAAAADLHPLVDGTGGRYAVTQAGEAVLAGDAARAAHDHWIGGVHLAPGHPRWAWDTAAREAVLS